jgi:hypothetical protein
MTFVEILKRVAASAEYVCFVPDDRLASLIRSSQVPGNEYAMGELLFRLWLYRGDCPESIEQGLERMLQEAPELVAFVRERVLPAREEAQEEKVFNERRAWLQRCSRKPCEVEDFFTKRVRSFRSAAGVILVVDSDHRNAYPVPFELRSEVHPEWTVTDVAGNRIPVWEEGLRSLWENVGRHWLHIPLKLGQQGEDLKLTGGSLALPVGLAVKYQGEPGYDPLLVLSTGAVINGRVTRVEGCELKCALARKMGARFWFVPSDVGPDGGPEATRRINLLEDQLDRVLDRVHSLLQDEGLATLDVPSALRLIPRLRSLSASGFPPGLLLEKATRCLQLFEQANNPALNHEAIPEAKILIGALENHAGHAGRAEAMLQSVAGFSADNRRMFLKVIPHRVVSFTDMGRFEEAEMWGRKAFEWAEAQPQDRDGLEARIEASGSLGGDALLQMALRLDDQSLALESRQLLEKNRAWAEQLHQFYPVAGHRDERNWVTMSASRVALWAAFFEPQNISAWVEQAGNCIRQVIPKATLRDSSHDYLLRTALLGEFRALLSGFEIPRRDWSLPTDEAPRWVKATALKYRAALHAYHGETGLALSDFKKAYEQLRSEHAPVIRTIGWSIAAQAVLSLPNEDSQEFNAWLCECSPYVVDYLSGFSPSRKLAKIFDDGGRTPEHLREFQRGFAY